MLGGVLLVAAANFAWQLGSSSYFVDEVLSVQHALPHVSSLITVVDRAETTPWTFFLFLHEWLYRTGSESEWVARLPSAIAGVALIAAVFWAARAFLPSRAALGAAALAALSPLILEYAQQVRVYVFVMLAATIAVGATVRGAADSRRRARLLICGAAAAVLALWLHYTAVFVVAPLCVWIALQRELPAAARVAFVGVCAVALGAEVPLFLKQYQYAPNGGLGPAYGLSFTTLMEIGATPFDSRVTTDTDWVRVVGVLVVVAACAVLLSRQTGGIRHRVLVAALAATAPTAIFVLGVAGKDVVISRYTAAAAPMLAIAIAAAVASVGRRWGALLAAAAAVAAVAGLVRSHQETGFYAPAKATIAYVLTHAPPGTPIVTPGHPGADIPLDYYGQRLLPPGTPIASAADHGAVLQLLSRHRPVWIVTEIGPGRANLARLVTALSLLLGPFHYQVGSMHPITTTTTFVATLATRTRP